MTIVTDPGVGTRLAHTRTDWDGLEALRDGDPMMAMMGLATLAPHLGLVVDPRDTGVLRGAYGRGGDPR